MTLSLRSILPNDNRKLITVPEGLRKRNLSRIQLPEVPTPGPFFLISEDENHSPLSLYSHDRWDLSPYQRTSKASLASINFRSLPTSTVPSAKWIMFSILFMSNPFSRTQLTVNTIIGYVKAVRRLAFFAVERGYDMLKILSNEDQLAEFIESLQSATVLASLRPVIWHLHSIGIERTRVPVLRTLAYELIHSKLSKFEEYKQHPVIPPRILTNLISELKDFLLEIEPHGDSLRLIIVELSKNRCLGRKVSAQRKLSRKEADLLPDFFSVAHDLELDILFKKYDVACVVSLQSFLAKVQHACKLYVHIYSGMRDDEALSLKADCLRSEKSATGAMEVYKLKGITTKQSSSRKPVSWITSKEVCIAISVAKRIAEAVATLHRLEANETPLFVALSYAGLQGDIKPIAGRMRTASFSIKGQEAVNCLNKSRFIITNEDIKHLEKMDPFRAWQSEGPFSIGEQWRFTTHQFRRSLAFYVCQTSLVSLPSLRRQLKHISRDMTVYYCQSNDVSLEFDAHNHFSKMLEKTKPEADSIAYIYDILQSEEELAGPSGKFIERNVRERQPELLLKSSRKELASDFKNGKRAYSVTAMGACSSVEPCDKRFFSLFSVCIGCKNSTVIPTKLENLIKHQKSFVQDLASGSIEHRTELAELEALVEFQQKLGVSDI